MRNSHFDPSFFADDSLFFMQANVVNCEELIAILQKHDCVFGQKVTFDKSNTSFNADISEEVTKEVTDRP